MYQQFHLAIYVNEDNEISIRQDDDNGQNIIYFTKDQCEFLIGAIRSAVREIEEAEAVNEENDLLGNRG